MDRSREEAAVKLWKVLGLAGLAGVAATGAIIARDQRQRAQLGPEEVRSRLHERLRESAAAPESESPAAGTETQQRRPAWRRLVPRRGVR
ncbi:hypothetical protein [Nocardioides ferulae]|uniref:hypothetical protein n=1 Tax=Nocardioides ferulae TaxID=2340821 RepID=UPI000EB578A6|nr:hypothetical protein [Nocardioides ferulae]